MTLRTRHLALYSLLGFVALWAACDHRSVALEDAGVPGDGWTTPDIARCTPGGDYDGDGLTNADEGCSASRDSDGDKVPDWQDLDSDNDKIPDHVEVGPRSSSGRCAGPTYPGKDGWPCDTDGDGVPDHLDLDSDGDGVKDGDEDLNGDGLVGCCVKTCHKPGAAWQKKNCKLSAGGCGPGQTCKAGLCSPATSFSCSKGETDPKKKDYFPGGTSGSYICKDASAENPYGRKAVQLRSSAAGDLQVALEKSAKYATLKVSGLGAGLAAVMDHPDPKERVAAFVFSLPGTHSSVQQEQTQLLQRLQKQPYTVSLRASGIRGKTHDSFDLIQGTTVDLTLSYSDGLAKTRNAVLAALLGKTVPDLGLVPAYFGGSHSKMVLRLATVRRFAFKKDSAGKPVLAAAGHPTDSGDKSKWRVLVVGALSGGTDDANPKLQTNFVSTDLTNGTALASSSSLLVNECDVGKITSLPTADIIWVIDESGSMSDSRQDLVNNANNFFSRALSSGLDFRMGVTGVCSPVGSYKAAVGKFCSKVSPNTADMGGTDRFLLPSEQMLFSACVKNPPGYEGASEYGLVNAKAAVTSHLPRVASSPGKIRPGASLAIIVYTDEMPNSLANVVSSGGTPQCTLPASTRAKVDAILKPYRDLFTGAADPEAAATFHVVGGTCNNSCSAQVAHGYRDLAQDLGGQVGDVCQKNLGNTLQAIIDSIVARASPMVLERVPVSASLAVALDAVAVKRSRTNGFAFRAENNSLVFINVKYKKGSEVIASYSRWW